ncbi:hypothetical protein HMPREF9104_00791 [Lentilactobacillus kisonensis F0435]|uniref:Uncharacterized protein n=1 Tax=Lentilactobacillus kisonensis F0435 TaxID=797516 RepID=H1LDW6_9LACO|nr:hypothetical protein HMPREF9104_00791 [Lentilactobacillus kisonensis F0435]
MLEVLTRRFLLCGAVLLNIKAKPSLDKKALSYTTLDVSLCFTEWVTHCNQDLKLFPNRQLIKQKNHPIKRIQNEVETIKLPRPCLYIKPKLIGGTHGKY